MPGIFLAVSPQMYSSYISNQTVRGCRYSKSFSIMNCKCSICSSPRIIVTYSNALLDFTCYLFGELFFLYTRKHQIIQKGNDFAFLFRLTEIGKGRQIIHKEILEVCHFDDSGGPCTFTWQLLYRICNVE